METTPETQAESNEEKFSRNIAIIAEWDQKLILAYIAASLDRVAASLDQARKNQFTVGIELAQRLDTIIGELRTGTFDVSGTVTVDEVRGVVTVDNVLGTL